MSAPVPSLRVALSVAVACRRHRREVAGLLALTALALAALDAHAQQRGTTVSTGFTATQLFTDNRAITATDRQADAVTVLTPSVRIASRSGRVQGSIDYSLSGVLYARDSSANTIQNALAARLAAELIERHGYLDVRASIGQQAVSALGTQSSRTTTVNDNRAELRTLGVAPSLRGRLFGNVDVEARLDSSWSSSSGNAAGDIASNRASLRIGSDRGSRVGAGSGGRAQADDRGGASAKLGWSLDASRSISDYDRGRRTTEDRLVALVSYTPQPGLRLFTTAGREWNDIQTIDQRGYSNYGGGVNWQPTPRTRLGLQVERRYFGNSHSFNFSHRLRRAIVSYADSRSALNSTAGVGATLSVYDLYFAQFASLEPDPVLRDVLVRTFLRAAGLDPNQRLTGGFINAAVSVQRSRNLSLAWQGRRNSAVLTAFSTATERADTLSNAQDDLSQVGELRQQGWSLSLSHRLTATSSVVLSLSEQRTPSRGGVSGNDLRSVDLGWTHRVSERASVSAGARRSQATGANAYDENSVSASLRLSF